MFIFNMLVVEIIILRITPILYVIKKSFDWTNLYSFLHCFWLFFISQTTVEPIQVLFIYSIIYSSSIVFWCFLNFLQDIFSIVLLLIFELCVSYLLGQRPLILNLVLGCDYKCLVGRIQTVHTDFIPLQLYGKS